jgi:multidrug efflux pump subunit AcrA (membrane-fusion protein)
MADVKRSLDVWRGSTEHQPQNVRPELPRRYGKAMADSQPFRRAAIEKLASPERLDVLMQVTSPMGWVAAATVAFFLACAGVWSVTGSIPSRVDAQGILVDSGGFREIRATRGGTITKLDLKLNDDVRPGQLVAEVAAGSGDNAADGSRIDRSTVTNQAAWVGRLMATTEGRVVDLKKKAGDRVTPGAVIALLAAPSGRLQPVAFVDSSEGKRIRPGMEAQISPATVKREEYGFMKGTVQFVGDSPVTPDAAMSIGASQSLAQELIGSGAKFEMRAALKPNQQAASGYEWSSRGGPPFRVDTGTRVTVSVVVDRKRPISYILPVLRSTFGAG